MVLGLFDFMDGNFVVEFVAGVGTLSSAFIVVAVLSVIEVESLLELSYIDFSFIFSFILYSNYCSITSSSCDFISSSYFFAPSFNRFMLH